MRGFRTPAVQTPRNVPDCPRLHKVSGRPQGLEALPAEMAREL